MPHNTDEQLAGEACRASSGGRGVTASGSAWPPVGQKARQRGDRVNEASKPGEALRPTGKSAECMSGVHGADAQTSS